MTPILKRLILAGLMVLPAACATYSRQYYDSGYAYYPAQYGAGYGYGVVERNYYNTYSYPAPVYRTEEYHHHHHDGGRDRHYSDRHDHDGRHYSGSPATLYRPPGTRDRDRKDHYNWNAPAAKPYGYRNGDHDRQKHDGRHDEPRQHRPADPNAYGQWQRQQNGHRQQTGRQNSGFGEHSQARDRTGPGWQNNNSVVQKNGQQGPQRQRPERWRDRKQIEAQNGQYPL